MNAATGRHGHRDAALLLIAAGLYAALALASYKADPFRPSIHGGDWVGPVGAVFAGACIHAVGIVAWLAPLELALFARPLLADSVSPSLPPHRLWMPLWSSATKARKCWSEGADEFSAPSPGGSTQPPPLGAQPPRATERRNAYAAARIVDRTRSFSQSLR